MATNSAAIGALMRRGLLLRLFVAVAVHYLLGPAALAPDQDTYDWVGTQLAQYWRGELFASPRLVLGNDPVGYYYVVGIIYFAFGHWPLLPKFANCLVGMLMIPLVHGISVKMTGDEHAALRGARYTAYFPSLVLWSSLNLRDIWTAYLILLACYLAMALQDSPSLRRLLLLGGVIFFLTRFRSYILMPIAVPIVLSFLIRGRRNLARNLVLGGLVGVAVLWVNSSTSAQARLRMPSLETIQEYRFFTSLGAQQYEATADISTPVKAAMFLPKGVIFFLFAPFPWQIRNAVQASTVPEMLFLYSLVPGMVVGLKHLVSSRLSDALMPLLIVAALTLGYALGQSNVGTAYRHRAQVLPVYLIIAAMGVELRRRRFSVAVPAPAAA